VIQAASIVAAHNEAAHARIKVAEVENKMARMFRQQIETRRIDVEVEAARELSDEPSPLDRFIRGQAESMNRAPLDARLNTQHKLRSKAESVAGGIVRMVAGRIAPVPMSTTRTNMPNRCSLAKQGEPFPHFSVVSYAGLR
jgi:hypothetical protein